MTREHSNCLVVGASMAGMRAAEAVRKSGFQGTITLVGEEKYAPYNRPPLSKDALKSGIVVEDLVFKPSRHGESVRSILGRKAVASELDARTVTLDNGDVIEWDAIVIASGMRARRLDLPGPETGRFVIRTIDDALVLREKLRRGTRLVILGAGFVGCELASTARDMGVEVTIVSPEKYPMERPLGAELGTFLRTKHEERGVNFRLGVYPQRYCGTDVVTGVECSDGTIVDACVVDADIVVEAIGCVPNVEWLEGNSLDVSDGVLCDSNLRVVGWDNVFACGDIARFPNALFDGVARRVEHWTMVTDTAKRAGNSASRFLSEQPLDGEPFSALPSFWSDQCGIRIQSYGSIGLADSTRVLERDESGESDDSVTGFYRGDDLIGVVLMGFAARNAHYRGVVSSALAAAVY